MGSNRNFLIRKPKREGSYRTARRSKTVSPASEAIPQPLRRPNVRLGAETAGGGGARLGSGRSEAQRYPLRSSGRV
jgi:hypothetical protein